MRVEEGGLVRAFLSACGGLGRGGLLRGGGRRVARCGGGGDLILGLFLGGVVAGSLVIGLTQQLVGGYIFPAYASTLPFVLLFLMIVVRPTGLVDLERTRL